MMIIYIYDIYVYLYYGINENKNLMLIASCVRRFCFGLFFGCKSMLAQKCGLLLRTWAYASKISLES